MANNRFNKQIQTIPEKTSGGKGVKPVGAGSPDLSMPMRTAKWPGLPGKAQSKDRSNGVPSEKIYVVAQGLKGADDADDVGQKDY